MARGPRAALDASLLLGRLRTQSDIKARRVIRQIVEMGPAVLPTVLKAAKDESSPLVRKWCLQALGHFKSAQALPVLRRALKDPRMTVRLHARIALRT